MALQEKLKKGEEFKLKGNESFKNGDLKAAIQNYYFAITHVKGLDQSNLPIMEGYKPAHAAKLTEKETEECKNILLACYNNLSACHLKLSNWDKSLENAGYAIGLDPQNGKAHYRKGEAYFQKNDLYKAQEEFQKTLLLVPKDPNTIKRLEDITRHLNAKYGQKEKKVFQKMMQSE
jgi:tetratricopeptide (TPR) repeat protein